MNKLEAAAYVISQFEGFSPIIYKDVAGYPTIGYGHLITSHDDYDADTHLTHEQGIELLMKDIESRRRIFASSLDVLDVGEYAALMSLVFNIGGGAYAKSSVAVAIYKYCCVRHAKQEQYDIAERVSHWRRAAGKIVAGLMKRRLVETMVFLNEILDIDGPKPTEQLGSPVPMMITDENWGKLSKELRADAIEMAKDILGHINA